VPESARSAAWAIPSLTPLGVNQHTNMTTRDELIAWLRDAYAMERGLEITLTAHAESEELPPNLRHKAHEHLVETREHAELVRACLEDLGEDTSTLKTGIAQVVETAKSLGAVFSRDERVKDVLTAYATEHFEIACYTALRAAAMLGGHATIVAVCDDIIPDEQRMAEWLEANLPEIVTSYLVDVASHAA